MAIKHFVWVAVVAVALGLLLFFIATAVGAADTERGMLLYQARCVGCHDQSVHNREARKALTVEAIKAQVRRWDAVMGGAWREAEVNDVSAYLNELYYRYPCPPSICPEQKAGSSEPPQARARGGPAPR